MQFDLNSLATAARATLQNPRAAARALINMDIPQAAGWAAVALMVICSGLLSSVALLLTPMELDPAMATMMQSPFRLVALQGLVLVVALMLVHGVGRFFGGVGRFSDALVLVAWIEFLLTSLQLVQVVLLVVLPPVAEVLGLFGIVLFLWLLSNFVAELHGFASVGMVFGAIIATVLAISFAMALVAVGVLGAGA